MIILYSFHIVAIWLVLIEDTWWLIKPSESITHIYTKMINEKDIKLARQCADLKGLYCANKDCTNESCMLNKKYD